MTAQIQISDTAPHVTPIQNDDSSVVLKVSTKTVTFNLNVGSNPDDVDALRDELHKAAFALTEMIENQENLPNPDNDGFVSLYQGAYRASIFGNPLGGARGFPTSDIAIFTLAEAMARAGEFPGAWFEGEHGPSVRDIGDEIRKFHNEGGDKMLPLEGVQYAEGTGITDLETTVEVDRDYGTLGIDGHVYGDPGVRVFIDHEHRDQWSLAHAPL